MKKELLSKNNRTVFQEVERILAEDPRARNDDKYLTFLVMRQYTNIYINYKDFEKIPHFNTITRARQKIQNTYNKFRPTNSKINKVRCKHYA